MNMNRAVGYTMVLAGCTALLALGVSLDSLAVSDTARDNVLDYRNRVYEFTKNTDHRYHVDVCRHMTPVFAFNAMARDQGIDPVPVDSDIMDICSREIRRANQKYQQR